MHMDVACIACFMHQGLRASRKVTSDPHIQRRVVQAFARRLGELTDEDFAGPPPALAREMYDIAAGITGCEDPYLEEKRDANAKVVALLPLLEKMVADHPDPFRAALAVSIIGNFIDSGVAEVFDWEQALSSEKGSERDADPALRGAAFDDFLAACSPGAEVLILGDNAGEIGLDTLLVRQLTARECRVTYAVRGRPILNDATEEDARLFGMDSLCRLITSGSDAPGTVLSRCTPEFLDEMRAADVILSKGQGNFEALEGNWPGIFFAFKAKCSVVCRKLDLPSGSSVFIQR